MTEYGGKGPNAAWDAIGAAIDSAVLSGIVGDSAHTYGYHRGRNYVGSDDYSVQQSDDQKGPGEAAVGLDVNLSDADMKTVSKRLNAAVDNDDDRLLSLREWYGTTNGWEVTGRDVRTGNWITSDDSHLWHVHLSFYRRWADDETECQKVAAVFTGGAAAPPPEEEDVPAKLSTFWCGKTQNLGDQNWHTLTISDDGSQSILWGPKDFWLTAHVTVQNLTAGRAVKLRLYELDVKSGAEKRGTNYPLTEILGTSGGSYGLHAEMGRIGAPASGYDSRRLRIEALSDESNTAQITGISTRLFSQ